MGRKLGTKDIIYTLLKVAVLALFSYFAGGYILRMIFGPGESDR